jgi:hypothetical protein
MNMEAIAWMAQQRWQDALQEAEKQRLVRAVTPQNSGRRIPAWAWAVILAMGTLVQSIRD